MSRGKGFLETAITDCQYRSTSLSSGQMPLCNSSSQNSAKYGIVFRAFSRELAVPPSKLVLLFNAAFCRRYQLLCY